MERPRYTRDDVDAILLDSSVPGQRIGTVEVGELTLSEDARLDHARWDALMEGDRKFRLSWHRKRQDLKDTSASGYDLSIASLAVLAGWPDQEIVNALICCRRKHGDDLKLRVDYYQRTIATARETNAHEAAVNELEKLQAQPKAESSGDAKEQLRRLLQGALRVNIERLIKYDAPDGGSEYELFVEGTSIRTGQIANLLSHPQLRNRIADACGKVIPSYKGERWRIVTQALMDLTEVRDIGESGSEREQMLAWLSAYLEDHPASKSRTKDVVAQREPFETNGSTFLFLDQFQTWLSHARETRLGPKELGVRFRRCGCEPQVIAHEQGGKATTREVWPVPELYEREQNGKLETDQGQKD